MSLLYEARRQFISEVLQRSSALFTVCVNKCVRARMAKDCGGKGSDRVTVCSILFRAECVVRVCVCVCVCASPKQSVSSQGTHTNRGGER